MNTIIVTRHPGAIAWLRTKKIEGEVIAHLDPSKLKTPTRVIGVFPITLAEELLREGHTVDTLVLPSVSPDQRGKELSPAEMDAAGASIRRVETLRTVPI